MFKAKDREMEGYVEKHHIIPKCMGGSDDISNLIKLTPEEHYVAHQLLLKIYPDNCSLIFAAAFMVAKRNNNKLYGWLKRKRANAMSLKQSGKGNSQYDTCWVSHITNKKCKKIKKGELVIYLQEGWIKKRIMDFDGYFERIKPKANKGNYKWNPLKGKNSCMWQGYWITPKGKFETCEQAALANDCCVKTIWNRAMNPNFTDYTLEPK